jgi:type II secretory pathway component PulJ
MSMMRGSSHRRARQRGLSIVELMVGITIGLIVVAAATVVVTNQVVDNRRLLLETQLQQDLRASADIITRELRRSGALLQEAALYTVWHPGLTGDVFANPRATPLTPASGTSTETTFSYHAAVGVLGTPYGYRLTGGVIQTRLQAGGWQDLTDGRAMEITAFNVTRLPDTSLRVPCPKPCADATASCWPTVNVRNLVVSIAARSRTAPEIDRSIRTQVRVRNEHFVFANGSTTHVCPS